MKEITVDYEKTRTEVASFLRSFADELERDERITLITGNDSATINPPEHLHFKVESDVDGSWTGSNEGRSLRLELAWEEADEPANEELSVVSGRRGRSDDSKSGIDATPGQ